MTEGKPQDVPETNRSIRNLYDTGAFSRVDIESTVRDKNTPAATPAQRK